ncbi:hypothetical protein LTR94_027185, partial [Friedmanniomyces endolithicus]
VVSGEAATFRADADAAAAETEVARQAYQRNRNLADQGVVARQEVEASRAQLLSAEAGARAARARSSAAGSPNASGRLSVTSPITGVVTSVQVGPGGFVAPGGVVAEVTNPARVELVFNAPPALAANVRAGAPLRVSSPSGDFDAIVTGVAAGAGGESGATVIRARPTGSVLPPAGSAVTGAIVTGETTGGLTVPTESVQTVDGNTVVFVQVPNGFQARPVLAGRQAGGRTEILRGLTGAERVAGTNAFLLKAELAKGAHRMFKFIIELSVKFRWFVVLATALIAAYGLLELTRLPIDAVPDITNRQVQVTTVAPALAPEQIERQVTYPIETAMAGIPGLTTTRSLSRNGFSQVTVIFTDQTDIYFARQQVAERLAGAREAMPDGVEPTMAPITTGL